MKRFAAAEATMEQRAQEQQLELLILKADEVTPQLFDVATRTEIVSLLKALLSDRLSLIRTTAETDND
jgi:hypothetical protein